VGIITVRPAGPADRPFLEQMLALAFNWRPDRRPESLDALMRRPDVAHYIEGWPRMGDQGCVAENEAGASVGAAWWRFLPSKDPGYGYVDDRIPEITIGVSPGHRGHGVGRALLHALIEAAHRHGLKGLSLSAEPENMTAHSLYRRVGFEVLGHVENADTMLLGLQAPPQPTDGFPTMR
jgi:ribosomal protein S18 acetylase RimI-like enzyme